MSWLEIQKERNIDKKKYMGTMRMKKEDIVGFWHIRNTFTIFLPGGHSYRRDGIDKETIDKIKKALVEEGDSVIIIKQPPKKEGEE